MTPIKTYIREWGGHINDLFRLGWNLEEQERMELKNIISNLHELLGKATANLKAKRKRKEATIT